MFRQGLGKVLVLSIFLVLPVGVYLFLKLFGTNHYDLPTFTTVKKSDGGVLFTQSKIEAVISSKPISVTIESFGWADKRYTSKNSLLSRIQDRYSSSEVVKIVSFDDTLIATNKEKYFPIGLPDTSIWKFLLYDTLNGFSISEIVVEEDQENRTIPIESVFILKDNDLRIRGIFDSREEKEFERLILEIEVLLYGGSK